MTKAVQSRLIRKSILEDLSSVEREIPVSVIFGKKLSGKTPEQIAHSYRISVDSVEKAIQHITGPYQRKWRDRCVLCVDDCFDSDEAPQKLLATGYLLVESFVTHFPRAEGGREQGVKDPRTIKLCDQHGWLLVTTDSNIRSAHAEEIRKCKNLAILATAHNTVENIDSWIDGLRKGRSKTEREFKKLDRPWFAQFNRSGQLTTIRSLSDAKNR